MTANTLIKVCDRLNESFHESFGAPDDFPSPWSISIEYHDSHVLFCGQSIWRESNEPYVITANKLEKHCIEKMQWLLGGKA